MTRRTPFRRDPVSLAGVPLYRPALLVLLFLMGTGIAARGGFRFADYTDLHSRDPFDIRMRSLQGSSGTTGTRLVGAGQILVLTDSRLEVAFHASPTGLALEGRMDLRFIKETEDGILLQLDYSGRRNGLPDAGSEKVLADRFLAKNGILTFHFDGGRRFVQISKDSGGRSRFITEWGSTLLVKRTGKPSEMQ